MYSKSMQFCLPILLLLATEALCVPGIVLTSTLNSTNRGYACPEETVVATCSGGIGTELEWDYMYNGTQCDFLFDDNTSELPTGRLFGPYFSAHLINRTGAPNETFRYISQFLINGITFDVVNITCTVRSGFVNTMDSDVCRSLSIRRSAQPRESALIESDQLECMGQGENTAQYFLEWAPPNNIDEFDLSYYEIKITGPSPNMDKTLLCVNNSAIVSFDLSTNLDAVMVSIMAVNQCGQRGVAMERSVRLGTCQSSASVNLKLSSLYVWILLLIAGTIAFAC